MQQNNGSITGHHDMCIRHKEQHSNGSCVYLVKMQGQQTGKVFASYAVELEKGMMVYQMHNVWAHMLPVRLKIGFLNMLTISQLQV